MIRISQLKLPAGHSKTELYHKAAKALHIKSEQIASLQIRRQSIDARKKPDIFLIYVVDITLNGISEQNCVSRSKNKDVSIVTERPYQFPKPGTKALRRRPVIIGSGPAGLFCCYMLAQNGYRPILLERGKDVEARKKDVEAFWNGGPLNPESNVSFGEGGAGTFSDGKLNTLIKDKDGRGRHVLSIFVENGAQPEILYDAKPHIGTDVLSNVVKQMRKKIIQLGGEVRFESRVETFRTENGALTGVILSDGSVIDTETAVLAIGHSARDTFFKLYESGLHMEAKAFAVGLRVEHPQELINQSQYGTLHPDSLGAAPYKVTARTSGGRGVYSFCMCPGGYVVNASSEPGRIAVNGMSYSGRNSTNANSAVIITITPEDYGDSKDPLSGVAFQRKLEEKAYQIGNGKVPVERYGSFKRAVLGTKHQKPETTQEELKETESMGLEAITPCIKGQWTEAPVHEILPDALNHAFVEGMEAFGKKIHGFNGDEVLVEGIESRTSSPVRILRTESAQSLAVEGLYPCGEGAGYAGGITSAAMDGIFVAEQLARALQEEV